VVVLPYEGKWKDVGTWDALTEEMANKLIGKGEIRCESDNSHVINELDIPVVVLDVPDVVVAASPDGILVSHKESSSKVKEISIIDQRPMYVERRWGWYKIIDFTKTEEGNEILVKKVC